MEKYQIGTKLIWRMSPHSQAEITGVISGGDKGAETVFYVVPGFGNLTAEELDARFYVKL